MITDDPDPIEQPRLPDESEIDALVEHVMKYPKLREYVLSWQDTHITSPEGEKQAIRQVLDTAWIAVVDGYGAGRLEPPFPKKAISVFYPFGNGDGEAEFLLCYDEQDGGIVPMYSEREWYKTEAK